MYKNIHPCTLPVSVQHVRQLSTKYRHFTYTPVSTTDTVRRLLHVGWYQLWWCQHVQLASTWRGEDEALSEWLLVKSWVNVYYWHNHGHVKNLNASAPRNSLDQAQKNAKALPSVLMTKEPVEEERVYLAYIFTPIHHWRKSAQKLKQGRNLEAGADAEACLLACSADKNPGPSA